MPEPEPTFLTVAEWEEQMALWSATFRPKGDFERYTREWNAVGATMPVRDTEEAFRAYFLRTGGAPHPQDPVEGRDRTGEPT